MGPLTWPALVMVCSLNSLNDDQVIALSVQLMPFLVGSATLNIKIKQFLTQIECIDFSILLLQISVKQKQNLII